MTTSVVIPVFNGRAVLERTVPAVLALQHVTEWIWVDDGSTDGTADRLAEQIARHPQARCLRLPSNVGRAAARNAGWTAARGRMVAFFDVDVEPAVESAWCLAQTASQPGAVAAVARLEPVVTDPDEAYQDYVRRYPRGPQPDTPSASPLDWSHLTSGACAIRRDLLDQVGGFPEHIEYGEDLALGCRLAPRHPKGLRLADTTVRLHDIGDLPRALEHAAAFGRMLPRLADLCSHGRVRRLATIARLVPGPDVAVRLLEWGIARSGPGPARRKAVRYLLAATMLAAHRRDRPDPHPARGVHPPGV